jgi:hypothetical protein
MLDDDRFLVLGEDRRFFGWGYAMLFSLLVWGAIVLTLIAVL